MFRKSIRHAGGKFELAEVITLCDHLITLGYRELEDELLWKPLAIASYGLVKRPRFDTVKARGISVHHCAPTPNEDNSAPDVGGGRRIKTLGADPGLLIVWPFR
jgi:hypothetical protein